MMTAKTPFYTKYLAYLKDAAYIIGICVALYGWISTKSKNEAILETTIKYNTETVKRLEIFMDKQIELNGRQAEFNGRVGQFINNHEK
jgi:hypothetical protein